MNHITYLKNTPFVKKLFGFSLVILAFVVLFNSIIFFAIFLVLGLNLISTEGSEIDLDSKTYRNIKSIFGIKFGKWQTCPNFEYITVFKTKEKQTISVVTATTELTSEVFLINLFYNRNKHITFYKSTNKNDAFQKAKHIKNIFEIDILDATSKEKKWL